MSLRYSISKQQAKDYSILNNDALSCKFQDLKKSDEINVKILRKNRIKRKSLIKDEMLWLNM